MEELKTREVGKRVLQGSRRENEEGHVFGMWKACNRLNGFNLDGLAPLETQRPLKIRSWSFSLSKPIRTPSMLEFRYTLIRSGHITQDSQRGHSGWLGLGSDLEGCRYLLGTMLSPNFERKNSFASSSYSMFLFSIPVYQHTQPSEFGQLSKDSMFLAGVLKAEYIYSSNGFLTTYCGILCLRRLVAYKRAKRCHTATVDLALHHTELSMLHS